MPSGIYINWQPLHAKIVEMAKTMHSREIHRAINAGIADESKKVTYTALRDYIDRSGIKTSRARKLDASDPQMMYELRYTHKMPVKEIAEKFDLSATWASTVIQDYRRGLESSGVQ
ncbi:hypothetical protein VP236O401_P0047 [Vibrio phage 236O40-1]|nr:hypothetical protein VP236O401_P0047 [Vibrio phage 236O40-1]